MPVKNRVTLKAFVAGLRELGYVDGQNIIIERQLSEANTDRLREAAAEFVKHNVDVIVTLSTTAVPRHQNMHRPEPIRTTSGMELRSACGYYF
jgi:putative ABC transport system substrate-binding protein